MTITIEEAKNIWATVERLDKTKTVFIAGLTDILTALGFDPVEGYEDYVVTRNMFKNIIENMHREDEDANRLSEILLSCNISVDALADMLDFYSENQHA